MHLPLLILGLIAMGLPGLAQSAPGAESRSTEPQNFYSGTVVEYAEGKIVVNRVVNGTTTENHSFSVTPSTKVEGTLQQGARVTVGYATSDEVDVAVRIIVRTGAKGAATSLTASSRAFSAPSLP